MTEPRDRYKIRQKTLTRLGFASYQEYLKSPIWQEIKRKVLDRDKGVCQICGKKDAYTAHHITYHEYVLNGEDISQLISVCRGCHHCSEFDSNSKLLATNAIARKSRKRRSKQKNSKNVKVYGQPDPHLAKCAICRRPNKQLGRHECCLNCHRSGRVLKMLQEQEIALHSAQAGKAVHGYRQSPADRSQGENTATAQICQPSEATHQITTGI